MTEIRVVLELGPNSLAALNALRQAAVALTGQPTATVSPTAADAIAAEVEAGKRRDAVRQGSKAAKHAPPVVRSVPRMEGEERPSERAMRLSAGKKPKLDPILEDPADHTELTVADCQKALQLTIKHDKTCAGAVKDLLKKCKVTRVTDLPPEMRATFVRGLTKLREVVS